jgi:mannose-1-phosphate guanylyltransferase
MIRPHRSKLWSIVLAGGEGARLRSLTRALHGTALPKQFAVIRGNRSLLQATIRRCASWSDAEHSVVVVAGEREALARRQLDDVDGVEIVAQPSNCGTAPGLLLPLCHVLARDPNAVVAVVPSDHHVADDRPMVESVRRAVALATATDSIVLIGAVPDGPEDQYGWIVPDGDSDRIRRFSEKPMLSIARELFTSGALWNTFMMVGHASKFWQLSRDALPRQCALFEAYQPAIGTLAERYVVKQLYEDMETADFSRDVLENADGLRFVRLSPCGWSDWGTPERVMRSLRGTDEHTALVERLRAKARARLSSKGRRAASVDERDSSAGHGAGE